jgi:ParB/RepB/Spo0J family partition protein
MNRVKQESKTITERVTKLLTLELPFQNASQIVSGRIPLSLVDVPPEYESKDALVEDDALRRSIEKSGVQQSIVVVPDGNRFSVAKGARRVRISQIIGLKDIPALVNAPPPGVDVKAYRDRLRMILTQARQDLFPSQRAGMIKRLIETFRMKQKDVAELLGVDARSIANWLSVERYIPAVVNALDSNAISMHHARAFAGMTPAGQEKVWKTTREKIVAMSGPRAHRLVRSLFDPKKHPEMYVAPEKTLDKLGRRQGKRSAKARPRLTRSEKEMLARDLDLREVELDEAKGELAELKKAIALATQPIRAIKHNEDLWLIIPAEMRDELERFYAVYC